MRRICIELDALGDKVVPSRKTHAFLKAIPDKHNSSFKIVLLCEKPRDGGAALDFEDIASRATSYHAMQIRGKVSVHDDGTGSHGLALNTVVHGGAPEFRRQGGRGQGRSRRGNTAGPRTVTPARRTVITTTVVSTPTGTHTVETCLLYTSPSPRD